MTDSLDEKELGQVLMDEGLITDVQLKTSLEYQASLGGDLDGIILKLGFVSENDLNKVMARRERIRPIDLTGRTVDSELMAKIPRAVIEKHEAVPLQHTDGTVLLALSEAGDFQAIEEVQFLTSCTVETALAPRSQILELISRFYDEHELLLDKEDVPLDAQLLARIADPSVAAAVRVLLKNGLIDAEDWQRELDGAE